jgi:hypothetical protein
MANFRISEADNSEIFALFRPVSSSLGAQNLIIHTKCVKFSNFEKFLIYLLTFSKENLTKSKKKLSGWNGHIKFTLRYFVKLKAEMYAINVSVSELAKKKAEHIYMTSDI